MRPLVRRGILVAVAVLALVIATACTSTNNAVDQQNGNTYRFVEGQSKGQIIAPDDRQSAPKVSGSLLDGDHFDLSSYHGSIVVLNFWASWCAPCRVELPELEKLYQKYQPDGVQMVGVLVRDDKQQGEIYGKQVGLTYPSVYDPDTKVALKFPNFPSLIPTTLIFDRKGRVAAAYISGVDGDSLGKTIQKLLAEK